MAMDIPSETLDFVRRRCLSFRIRRIRQLGFGKRLTTREDLPAGTKPKGPEPIIGWPSTS
jgi:hypothetical protein